MSGTPGEPRPASAEHLWEHRKKTPITKHRKLHTQVQIMTACLIQPQTLQWQSLWSSALIWRAHFKAVTGSKINCTNNCLLVWSSWHSWATATFRKETQTITCCWEKRGQEGREPTKNHHKASLQWIRSCWKTGVSVHSPSVFYINMSWEAAVLERSSWSRHSTLKLDWSLLLITWTKKKPSGGKTLVIWTNTQMFDHNEQQCVSRREGEAFNPK